MVTSPYFNNFDTQSEQNVLEDLLIESIKIYGIDVFYCPRVVNDKDDIYGEDPSSSYESNYPIEMYVRNIDGYEGEGVFLSRFGMEIRDQVTFSVAIRRFRNDVIGAVRPKEGDLIWFPLNPERPQLLQIKYVNDRALFYQLGSLQMYDLVCETFEYSGQRLSTGIYDIDIIQQNYSPDITLYQLLTANNEYIADENGYPILYEGFDIDDQVGDQFADNDEIQEQVTELNLLDFSESNPFSEGNY